MAKKKAALFGGTFNPPHRGHLLIAKEIMREFGIDRIFFIPSYLPPHKDLKNIIDASHRLKMTQLLIEGEEKFEVSDYEVKKSGVSYSIDTINHFLASYPDYELYFITGSDAFYEINTWKNYKEVLSLVKFIVYLREDITKEKIEEKHPESKAVLWPHGEKIHISASQLRERIKRGISCAGETGDKIWRYIEENGIYA